MTSRNEYDAFGAQTSTGTTSNKIGYTGQRLDNETGLMALGNGERYYSPSYARFIQQDSFAGFNQAPQTLNRYSYVANNPTKHTDPSGHIAPLLAIGIVVGVAFVAGFVFDAGRQVVDIATSEDKKWSDFSITQSLKSGVIGAAIVGGTIAAAALFLPTAAAITVAGIGLGIGFGIVGLASAAIEYEQGNKALAVYDAVGAILSFLGAGKSASSRGKPTVFQENVTKTKGTNEVPLTNEAPTTPKQLSGGKMQETIDAGRLLKAAPEEVVNPPKSTRLVADESGNVKDLSTGRGNLNKIGKSQEPIELFSKEEPYLDSKLLQLESNSQPQTNAHYRGKHGAQTTLEQQYNRAVNGTDPISGMPETYSNGTPKPKVNSTRFLSARDQMRTINRAKAIYKQQIQSGKTPQQARFEAQKPIKFSRVIGEGYQKETGMYSTSKTAKVIFDKNTFEVKTAFPLWDQ